METPRETDEFLTPLEARLLGCLLEKEATTPEYYPLTLNASVNAANQKSNRQPVMALTERDVELGYDSLRRKHLVALVSTAEGRVPRFKHTFDLVYPVEQAERALLCELLLRGPQTPGELRARCERLHPFPDLAGVETALHSLAERPSGPLVTALPRQPGRKEARFAQLLTPAPEETAESSDAPAAPLTVEMTLPAEVASRLEKLEAENAALRSDLDRLRADFDDLRGQLE